jgi:amino acid transporter
MPDYRIVQIVTLLIVAIGLIKWWRRIKQDREYIYFAIPPLTVLIHGALFYIVVFVDNPPAGTEFYTWWSSVLRLHTFMIVTGLAWLRITTMRTRR